MKYTKSIENLLKEANSTNEGGLKRTLGSWNLIALGIGAIIGAGLFVRTAAAAGAGHRTRLGALEQRPAGQLRADARSVECPHLRQSGGAGLVEGRTMRLRT